MEGYPTKLDKGTTSLPPFAQQCGECTRKEKKNKDCAFWHQFNEQLSITPGCPGASAS